jgi:hypothetical protein
MSKARHKVILGSVARYRLALLSQQEQEELIKRLVPDSKGQIPTQIDLESGKVTVNSRIVLLNYRGFRRKIASNLIIIDEISSEHITRERKKGIRVRRYDPSQSARISRTDYHVSKPSAEKADGISPRARVVPK